MEIVDFSYQCFRTYLLYLYTDRIEPPVTSAKDAAGKGVSNEVASRPFCEDYTNTI